MQPVVIPNYNLIAGNATSLVNANAATSSPLVLATTGVPGVWQRRVTITSQGNDSAIYFHIVGGNQAGFPIQEFIAGQNGSATAAQSNLDYLTIASITPSASSVAQSVASTAATVSAGVNGSGSCLWNILNWHVTPVNVSYATILTSGSATWSIQYTYDDPNNLPIGATYPQPFNHPVIVNASSTVDGNSNEPITAWRLLVSAGTGVIRAIGTQAGIGGP